MGHMLGWDRSQRRPCHLDGTRPMPQTLSAEFDTRRDAEMTVEHLVQEYKIDRQAISIVSASEDNTAGTKVAGSDLEDGRPKQDTDGRPALASKIRLSVDVDDDKKRDVLTSFATYNGQPV